MLCQRTLRNTENIIVLPELERIIDDRWDLEVEIEKKLEDRWSPGVLIEEIY